jgi:hypothetical protein
MTDSKMSMGTQNASGGAGGVPVAPEVNEGLSKRFTDAELAAEYWLLSSRRERMLGYQDGAGSEAEKQAHRDFERMEIILRFHTLPHHDREVS